MQKYIATWLLASASLFAGNVMTSPQITVEPPSFASVGFQVLYGGDDNANAAIGLRFRVFGSAVWRNAQPLIRVPVERVSWKTLPRQFGGSLFDLRPATAYEYELTISDPDGFSQAVYGVATTRALLAPPAAPRNVSVNSVSTLESALSAAQPGDVITIQPGTYTIFYLSINRSGTAANPIIIRGASREKVIMDGLNCGCNLFEVYGSYIRIESLTMRNADQAVRFFGPVTGNSITRTLMTNVQKGMNGQSGQSGFVIADNQIQGRVSFAPPYSGLPDSYAMQVFGSNHIVAHNEIKGFFDGIRLFGGANRNVDIYGNDIIYSADDGIELDDSDGNNRVLRNRIGNGDSGISTQPVAGGPAYILRNTIINSNNEQIKFHANGGPPVQSPSGVYVYHNTFVSPSNALSMYSSNPGYDSHFRNNVFHGPAAATSAAAWDGPSYGLSFDYNGYFPDGKSYWNWQGVYINYPNIAAASSAGIVERNGLALSGNVFMGGLTGAPSRYLWTPPQLPLLNNGGNSLGRAQILPNVNDFYAGAGPDLGAFESGCPPPLFGPRPAGIDESNDIRGCQESPVPANASPVNVSLSPARGIGSPRIFTASVTDNNGAADVETVNLLFGPSNTISQSCVVVLKRVTEQVYLYNDTGTALLGPMQPGSAQTLSNSRCSVNGARTSINYSSTQNMLQFSPEIAFANSFRASKEVYVNSVDLSGGNSGWTLIGAWR